MHARICRWRWRWPRPTAVTVTNSSCQRRRCTRYRRLCIPPSTHYAPSWAVGELWAFPFSTRPTVRFPLPTPHFPLPTSHFLLSTPFSFSTRRKDAFFSPPTSHYPLPAIIAQCSLVHWFLLTRRPIIRPPPPLPRFRTALITCHLLVSSHPFPSALSTHHPRPLTTDI